MIVLEFAIAALVATAVSLVVWAVAFAAKGFEKEVERERQRLVALPAEEQSKPSEELPSWGSPRRAGRR